MAYKNLRFFDSESNDLNLLYSSEKNIWEGVCYLPNVSVGLYETLTIYILEEVVGPLGNTKFVTPISENLGTSSFKFEFFSGYDFSEDIFLYSTKNNDGQLEIQRDSIQKFTLLDSSESSGVNSNGVKIINNSLPLSPIKCNVALMSNEDNFHTRLLDITEIDANGNETLIATIRIYGETEEEDERLAVLLSNIGMTLSPEDYMILKDSDIKELAPDWLLLNQKRKELLLQASTIKPFIGTYKAILNAIDFFGYSNLTLKEYWLNINEQSENFGKLKAVAVPNQDAVGFLADKNKGHELPSSNLKKTSRFSIVYRLNEADGGVDEWDIPTVKESTDYSPDEVLIKLYGLKNKLQKDFLPLQAKIVDITGEGDYFSQFNLNVWNNQHSIKVQNAGQNVDFSRFPKERQLFIEDLRKVDYRLTGIYQDFGALTNTDREQISESIQNFYNGYYNTDMSTFNTLVGIPVGCPVILNAESFIDSWDSAEFSYMDADDTGNHLLTWENWWKQGIYEMEWIISGPNGYLKSFRGGVGYVDNAGEFHPEYQQFPIVLPYTGNYSVELAIYDLYNVRSSYKAADYFEVKSKNVEVYGLFQRMLPKLNWNQYKYSYDVAGSDWDWSRENTADIDSIIATYYLTLDRANYVHDVENGVEFSTVRRYVDNSTVSGFNETAGPYQWKELKTHIWNDGEEVNWDMMRVGADINSSFKFDIRQDMGHSNQYSTMYIKQIDPVTNIEITDTYQITSTYPTGSADLTAWINVANELSGLSATAHPLFSKFNFNPVLVDNNGDGINDECTYILAVAQEPSRTHDFSSVGFLVSGVVDSIILTAPGTGYSPGLNQPTVYGTGSGLTIDIFSDIAGAIDTFGISNQGFGYTINDLVKIPTGGGDAEFEIASLISGGVIVAGSEIHFTSYNPDFNDICIIDTHMEVNMLNHVTFSFDTTNMPGIVSQKWTLKNISQNIDDIYYSNMWLTYLFKHKGDYNIELELTDVNGNKNTINKNILKII